MAAQVDDAAHEGRCLGDAGYGHEFDDLAHGTRLQGEDLFAESECQVLLCDVFAHVRFAPALEAFEFVVFIVASHVQGQTRCGSRLCGQGLG